MNKTSTLSASLSLTILMAAFGVNAVPQTALAQAPEKSAPAQGLPPFEALNPNEPSGDRLGSARRIAAAVVAADLPAPQQIVDVGSFTGEFLEAFMQQFPQSKGQWTEPVETNRANAHKRLARFGNQVNYVIGCPARDLSKGCVPAGVDVLITSWLSIHQDLEGIRKFYGEAAAMLPSGGWVVNLDHVGSGDKVWDQRLRKARDQATLDGLAATTEGPPVHHKDWVVPTLEEQLAALKAAGLDDVRVVWRRFDTVLIMGRKR